MKNVLAVWLIFAALIALPCRTGYAQIHKFQLHNTEKGLCNDFVYSIAQDKHGFIWFATGFGLCRYDGFRFLSPSDDLPSTNVSTSFRDDKGNLWFGYQDGIIVKYDGIDFSIVDISINAVVTQIIQAPKGEILAATQDGGIIRIGKKTDHFTTGFENAIVNSICFVDDERLMLGTSDGLCLFHYSSDEPDMKLISKGDDLSAVKFIIPKAGGDGYWVATEGDGIYYVTVDKNRFSVLRMTVPRLEEAQVQSINEDMNGNLWISTYGEGLFHVQLLPDKRILKTSIYNTTNGLGSDYVKQVFSDNQHNLWVATFGHGVACIINTAISFFETLEPVGNNATAVFSADNSEYWIAGVGAIIKITSKSEPNTVLGRNEGVPNDKITILRADDKGNLWIGTENSGLYKLPKGAKKVTEFYKEDNSLSNTIQSLIIENEKIWMATRNGILVIDAQTRKKTDQYNTVDGNLPHNNIQDIFKDSKNRIWIATNSNSLIDIKKGDRLSLPGNMETEFSAITEDEFGRIWAATRLIGVYRFDEARDTVIHFTANDDLKSDYCYAIASDGNGYVWVGHRGGLTSISTQRRALNTYGIENGIRGDVNPRAMMLNKSGELLIGMSDGVMMYDIKTDKPKNIIPMLNLSQVLINDKSYNPFKTIVLPYDKYKIEFDFVGLQYSNPGSVSYQYQLVDYDRGWTVLSKTNTAVYPKVEYGEFTFWVKACNSENCTAETMLFTIKIAKPFYLTPWFALLIVSAVVGLGYVVIAIRERNHKILQDYLENELKARTREVRKQKEEIEVKNRDITDSINYAQRIQFSVLPSTSTLLEHCSGAFIFYRPRDIVSGDFYWFDYFPNNNRLLIVCADSTGHGVPGAFMSLIGTTLIKDIAIRSDILNPADILYRLDENVQSTLNQNRDSEQANDGMDIIVCEIDTVTSFVKIASAMRPYVIYQNGVPTTYKSSRSSIGGQYVENKVFNTHEIQLSKGDTIYMFTDGYTDQFGGPSGKKLKMNRLQNILDDIHNRNMEEQYRVVKENFDLWKGHNAQVDDVLMIGVKI